MKERREHTRIALEVEVDFDSGHNFYTGEARDLSAGGLFIATEVAIPVGEKLNVNLALEGMSYKLQTEVMWTMADVSGKAIGVGCRFARLLPAQRKVIEAFIQKRIPMDFDLEVEDEEFERPSEHPLPTPRKKK